MPFDLRAALRAALDVNAPPLSLERVRGRTTNQVRALERRRTRTMLTAAALVAVLALFAGGADVVPIDASGVAVAPVPAPSPLAT